MVSLLLFAGMVSADYVDLGTSPSASLSSTTKVTSTLNGVTATIGDEANATFQPKLKISRQFFEDANFSISWNENAIGLGNADLSIENRIVKYKKTGMELWFYQLPDDANTPEGGFEFMAKINSKPAKNQFSFELTSNNLLFEYQPALEAKDEFKGMTCNATNCYNGSVLMATRPINVVGSYAVYHISKKDNQYQTGKVAHIYRPYVNDSSGKTSWANITITSTSMIITIEQKFLDTAVYPIYVDPSIGYAVVGASYANWAGDSIRGNYPFNPTSDGTLTTMNVYHNIGTSLGTWRGIVYINSTNAVRAFTSSYTQVASGAWESTAFNNGTLTIFAGTQYILGIWIGTSLNIVSMYYDSYTVNYSRGSQTFSADSMPTDPQPWASGKPVSGEQYRYSMYANYTIYYPTISFTVFTLGGGSNSTNSNGTIQNYTEAIYFNATSLNQWWIKPCANADGITNCQIGITKPIYRIVNTGTVAINYFLKLNSSLSGTPFKSCANSTANGGTVTATVSTCDLSGTEGNLNATAWLLLGNIGTNAQLNVTRYANLSGGTVPVSYLRYDQHNSTS